MSDAVARVLDLFRQYSKRGVTGVTHVTKARVTPKSSMATPVTPVTYLNQSQPTNYVSSAEALSDVYDLDERAAIAIYDGGIPEAYAGAFAQLQIAHPIGVSLPQWLRAVDDAGRFLDQWGHVAEQLQWSVEDLFKRPAPQRKRQPSILAPLDSVGSSTVATLLRSMLTPPRSATGGCFVHLINQLLPRRAHEIQDTRRRRRKGCCGDD